MLVNESGVKVHSGKLALDEGPVVGAGETGRAASEKKEQARMRRAVVAAHAARAERAADGVAEDPAGVAAREGDGRAKSGTPVLTRTQYAGLLVITVLIAVVVHLVAIRTVVGWMKTPVPAAKPVSEIVEVVPPRKEAVKIPQPDPPRAEEKVQAPKPPAADKERAGKAARARKAAVSPAVRKEKLGHRYMGMVRNNAFPSMTLDYADAGAYMRFMYQAGVVTLVQVPDTNELYRVNLFSGRADRVTAAQFSGSYSPYVLNVDDRLWDNVKSDLGVSLGLLADELEVKMLLPLSLHSRWVGHQVEIFSRLGLKVQSVASVDARVRNGVFSVTRVFLKDGGMRKITDTGV